MAVENNEPLDRFDHGRFGLLPKHRALAAHVTINDELPNRIISGTVVVSHAVILKIVFLFRIFIEDSTTVQCVDTNSLAIIGLIQPTGSIMPISEMQTRVFMGYINLPSQEKMKKNVNLKKKVMAREFVTSRRHTIQVYYVEYMDELAGLLGCRPSLWSKFFTDPLLAKTLLFHGLVPYQYRLQGPHKWKGAREAIITFEDRVFNTTRTRRTKETLRSKPTIKILNVVRVFQ
uniref:Flavin-containing monooxygenase n=1 Tax=Heterorhabditis bacteriophora TaxID=37862 RepID=A0A1I7XCB1_HETBA